MPRSARCAVRTRLLSLPRGGRARRGEACITTRPNAGHKAVFGPRISSPAGNKFKVQWKKRVLERMRAFGGDPKEILEYYLSDVMPAVWSELLAKG